MIAARIEYGLDGGSVCLEITESVVVQDIETTRVTLRGLKEAGVKIAIDDFGTGYSALSQVQRFPLDVLKIDRAFVEHAAAGGSPAAVTRTLVALGGALSARVVAEGIETTPAVLALAQRHGVEMPIAAEVGAVTTGRRTPDEALDALMGRPPRHEREEAELPT